MVFLKKKSYSTLYPLAPHESGIDISIIELLYNAENGINKRIKSTQDFFNQETSDLISKLHSQTLSDDDERKLNNKISIIKPYIDYWSKFSKSRFNPSPFIGMEQALTHSLNKLSDWILGDMPDALLRLYLDLFIPISYMRTAFDTVLESGDKLRDNLKLDKIPSDYSRKLAYDLYPDWFVTPKDQYIASLIHKFSNKGLSAVSCLLLKMHIDCFLRRSSLRRSQKNY